MKNFTCICLFIFVSISIQAQSVGIGTTTPNASALLDISSTTKGIRIPRMTTAQRDAIFTPAAGLLILNLDDYCLDVYDGSSWIKNCGYKVTGTDTAESERTVATFGGIARDGAVAFSIGTKGYVGTGSDAANSYKKDFWEYDPVTNTWTQKADFGGTARTNAIAFAANGSGYIGTGFDGNMKYDFWVYDPALNSWLNNTFYPGFVGRMNAVAFTIAGYVYIGLGYDPTTNTYFQDMHRYDPIGNTWINQTNYPHLGHSMVAFAPYPSGNYGYVGIGKIRNPPFGDYLDNSFYQFTPGGPGTWTALTAFPGALRKEAVGFCIGANGYVATGKSESATYYKDVWQYNIASNSWTQMSDLGYLGRARAVSFVVNNEAFIGTGYDGAYKSDFFGYVPYRIGPVYDNTLDLSVAGGISDGIWVKDLNAISTDNVGPSHMMITSTGNVGINTNISHAPLQLANGVLDRKIVLHEIADNNHQFFGFGIDQGGALRYQSGATTFDHVFYAGVNTTSSNELMRIKGNGLVGIGTNNPDNKLSVLNKFGIDANGSIRCKNNPRMLYFMEDGVANKMLLCHSPAFPTWGLQYLGTTNSFRFLADSASVMAVNLGGNNVEISNLGVGTPNPAYKLEVKTTTNQYGISHTDGTVHLATWIGDGGEIGTISNHTFRLFANNGVHQFELLPNGNVGIGLANPQNRVDIANGATRTNAHPTGRPLYITGSLGDASNGVEIRDFDATQGVGIGRNTVYAAGSWADQNLGLAGKGGLGNVLIITNGAERVRFSPTGQVGIGTQFPHAMLHLANATANRKIILNELADNDHQFDGIGINSDNSVRYQTQSTSNDHIFYAGASTTTSNELLRIKGNGNVAVAGVVETEAFIAPTLLNSFTNYGSGYASAGYYKDKMGIVHLHGLVQHVGEPDGLVIFTLPVGYRPSTSGELIFMSYNADTLGRVDVMANGNVVMSLGIPGWFSLNEITFRAD